MTKIRLVLLALILFWIFGCAPMTEQERELSAWKAGIDAENWSLCQMAYRQHGKPTIHIDHTHQRTRKDGTTPATRRWIVRQDLSDNNCSYILGDYWINY
jgi:hypothetical protein